MDLRRFESLKKRVDQLKKEHAKAEGMLEQVLRELEEKHGCKTIEQAEKLMAEKTAEAEAADKDYQSALDKFEKKWGNLLRDGL